jgi:hypothetical protein
VAPTTITTNKLATPSCRTAAKSFHLDRKDRLSRCSAWQFATHKIPLAELPLLAQIIRLRQVLFNSSLVHYREVERVECPRQTNLTDCGVFAARFTQCRFRGVALPAPKSAASRGIASRRYVFDALLRRRLNSDVPHCISTLAFAFT